jgi:hypothetical protein
MGYGHKAVPHADARLDGGIRNKAVRGKLRRGLPTRIVWGEAESEMPLHPDAAVVSTLRAVFAPFSEFGTGHRV